MLILATAEGGHINVDLGDGRTGKIHLVNLRGDHVRLGLEFDQTVKFERDKVAYERLRREAAARVAAERAARLPTSTEGSDK